MGVSDGSGPGTTSRERRNAARREQISGSSESLRRKGLSRGHHKDIAEAADVAEGTIYNYFENKDALLLALINSWRCSTSASRSWKPVCSRI
jgi:AcrR family transcriptional regulator